MKSKKQAVLILGGMTQEQFDTAMAALEAGSAFVAPTLDPMPESFPDPDVVWCHFCGAPLRDAQAEHDGPFTYCDNDGQCRNADDRALSGYHPSDTSGIYRLGCGCILGVHGTVFERCDMHAKLHYQSGGHTDD
jgi:hypothetical protein